MSLTFPAAYSAQLKSSFLDEDWLFQLYYTAEGANDWIGLASKDRIVTSVKYYGVVIDAGEISREIDLLNSSASVGTITITCVNKWKTDTLSAELLHGTNKYINHTVKIYSCINDEATLTNCAYIWRGKIKTIYHSIDTCTIEMETDSPFDYIQIPNVLSTYFKTRIPIVYGNYTKLSTGKNIGYDYTGPGLLHPVPFNQAYSDYVWALNHQADASDARLHIYEPNVREFVTLEIDDSPYYDDDTQSLDGANASKAQADLHHGWKQRPISTHLDNSFIDPGSAYDKDLTTFALPHTLETDVSGTGSHADSASEELVLDIPTIKYGRVTTFQIYVSWYLLIDAECDPNLGSVTFQQFTAQINDNTFSTPVNLVELQDVFGTRTGGLYEYDDSDTGSATTDHSAALATAGYVMPNKIRIEASLDQVGVSDEQDARTTAIITARIYNVYMIIDVDLDQANDPKGAAQTVSEIIHLYSGSDGFPQGYTDGEGGGATLASEVHQAHRDIMNRYAGIDYDNDYMTNWIAASPGDFDLDAARTGWDVRWWQLEPRSLREILDMLQYEGCFIFMLVHDSDGSGNAGGRYIWVQNTYASGLHTFTKDDYENIQISMTDPADLVTKTIYNYSKHPAEDTYLQTEESHENTTARDNWSLGTSREETVDLEALVNCGDNMQAVSLLAEALDDSETGVDVDDGTEFTAGDYIKVGTEIMLITSISTNTLTVVRGSLSSTAAAHNDNTQVYFYGWGSIYNTSSPDGDNLPNETIVLYYDNIKANPRILVSCDIHNKAKFNTEVGDVVKFDDSRIDAFGKTWSNLYFMIVEEHRTKNTLSIVAREVYSS